MISMAAFPTSSSIDLLRIKRWLGVLLVSILLHFVVIHWVRIPTPLSLPSSNVVHVSLNHAAIQDQRVAASAQQPIVNKHDLASSASEHTAQPAKAADRLSPPLLAQQNHSNIVTAAIESNQRTTIASAPQRTVLQYSINLPPSAELHYAVSALKKGIPFVGKSTVNWHSSSNQYRIDGAIDINDRVTRSFQSEGTIDQFGIAPLLYTEKSSNKSATNTHFQRERNIISFSSSEANYPRQGGEQDRASVIWQLAGIGRGSPDRLVLDADLDIFVAGVRDGETWRIHVINEEELDIPAGKINTWHLVRIPRPGSYEPKLDIWLAPLQAWYPVKLRYTQVNGDTLDMSLTQAISMTMQ